jgi:hypothetical protein
LERLVLLLRKNADQHPVVHSVEGSNTFKIAAAGGAAANRLRGVTPLSV